MGRGKGRDKGKSQKRAFPSINGIIIIIYRICSDINNFYLISKITKEFLLKGFINNVYCLSIL